VESQVRSLREGQSFDESQKHELSAAANRWIFVTPARMFRFRPQPKTSTSCCHAESGTGNLLTYNKSLDASRGSVFRIIKDAAKVGW
jgi:hypothetical protein